MCDVGSKASREGLEVPSSIASGMQPMIRENTTSLATPRSMPSDVIRLPMEVTWSVEGEVKQPSGCPGEGN